MTDGGGKRVISAISISLLIAGLSIPLQRFPRLCSGEASIFNEVIMSVDDNSQA
jgi:hypothetical protein